VKKILSENEIEMCPKCGSTNRRRPSTTMPGDGMISLPNNAGEFSECEDCGYIGIFITIDKSEIEEVRKEIKIANKEEEKEGKEKDKK